MWKNHDKRFPDFNQNFENFLNNLENLNEGEYLLITHPVLPTEEMKLYSTYWEDAETIIKKRTFDLKILTDEKVKEIIKNKGIKLKKFEKRSLNEKNRYFVFYLCWFYFCL